jgi:outer membrane protein assembly factor BamB
MLEAGAPGVQLIRAARDALAPFEDCLNLVGALINRGRRWWRVKWATVLLAGASALGLTVPACLFNQKLAACLSDRDCKLDRICDAGHCVWPGTVRPKANTPTAPTTPVPTPSGAPLSAAPAVISAEPPGGAGAPMFRFGPEHRGRSPGRVPVKKPEIVWSYETGGSVTSSPAIGPDGAILVGSHDGELHVVTREGKALWRFATGDMIFSSPALFRGAVAYIGSDDDHLYALDLTARRALWRFKVGACTRTIGVGPDASRCDADAGPTLGPNGVVYTGGDAVYAINPDGTLRWRYATGGHVSSAPALLPDGTVIAGCQDNLVYAIAPDGNKRWDFRAGNDIESAPAVAEDGTIYVGADDEKVYALARTGKLLWAFNAGGDVRASPAVGLDGTVYVGTFDASMYAIRRDGTLAWTFRTGDRIVSSALVDPDGTILFGSQDDRLYALDSKGQHRWSVELGGDVDSSPVIAPDGTIYVGSDDRKLYALRAK